MAAIRSRRGRRESGENTETHVAKLTLSGRTGRGSFVVGAIGGAVASVVLALAGMTVSASAGTLSDGDQQCLGCHGSPGIEKHLADGETLSLHIPGNTFAQSVLGAIGCTGCHADINLASHPPAKNTKGRNAARQGYPSWPPARTK